MGIRDWYYYSWNPNMATTPASPTSSAEATVNDESLNHSMSPFPLDESYNQSYWTWPIPGKRTICWMLVLFGVVLIALLISIALSPSASPQAARRDQEAIEDNPQTGGSFVLEGALLKGSEMSTETQPLFAEANLEPELSPGKDYSEVQRGSEGSTNTQPLSVDPEAEFPKVDDHSGVLNTSKMLTENQTLFAEPNLEPELSPGKDHSEVQKGSEGSTNTQPLSVDPDAELPNVDDHSGVLKESQMSTETQPVSGVHDPPQLSLVNDYRGVQKQKDTDMSSVTPPLSTTADSKLSNVNDDLGCSELFDCGTRPGSDSTDCIPEQLVCDGKVDCVVTGLDEANCIALSKSSSVLNTTQRQAENSTEGYVLVQVNRLWHPYCSDAWSTVVFQGICNHLGYSKVQEAQRYKLAHFSSKVKPHNGQRSSLLLLSGTGERLIYDDEIYRGNLASWVNCDIVYLYCF